MIVEMEKYQYDEIIKGLVNAQKSWRTVPAPQRGELIRRFGNALRRSYIYSPKSVLPRKK